MVRFIIKECVYCAIRTKSLSVTHINFSFYGVKVNVQDLYL
jgi:hypothetical protein